jgi:hypothetical protein
MAATRMLQLFKCDATGARLMILRIAIISLCLLDAAVWLLAADVYATPSSDTNTVDYLMVMIISLMFLFSGAPAFVIAVRGRSLNIALALALAFPAAFALLFVMPASW